MNLIFLYRLILILVRNEATSAEFSSSLCIPTGPSLRRAFSKYWVYRALYGKLGHKTEQTRPGSSGYSRYQSPLGGYSWDYGHEAYGVEVTSVLTFSRAFCCIVSMTVFPPGYILLCSTSFSSSNKVQSLVWRSEPSCVQMWWPPCRLCTAGVSADHFSLLDAPLPSAHTSVTAYVRLCCNH